MKQHLVVQHTYSEFLGTIEKQLEDRDIGFAYQRPFVGQSLPASALQFDALWLLGGAHAVADRAACPWLAEELRLIGSFRQAKRPVVAIGFGAHLLAQYEGGSASLEPVFDAYWTTAHATAAGRDDVLAQAVDGRRVLVMVNGSVSLPEGMQPIVTDDDGRWIAFRPHELACGMLFRPEIKPGMIEDMIMEEGRPLPEHIGTLLEEARACWGDMQVTTERVVAALVSGLDLMQERRKPPIFAINPVRS